MSLVPLNLFVQPRRAIGAPARDLPLQCGDACFHAAPNSSDNEYFGDVVKRRVAARRAAVQRVTVLAVGAGSALAACGRNEPPARLPRPSSRRSPRRRPG